MLNGFDFAATYTLAEAKSTIGTAADELNANNLQDAKLLYDDPRVFGPTSRTDARHSGSLSAVVMVKGFTISPIFLYRSPLPVAITEGSRRNLNCDNNDLPDRAYQFDGVGQPAEGHRRVRDVELRSRRVAHADEPSPLVQLRSLRPVAYRSHRRDLQPVQREEPVDLRDQSAERAVHAAERVLGRLPEPRAARRTDRVPLLLLDAETRTDTEARRHGRARGFGLAPFLFGDWAMGDCVIALGDWVIGRLIIGFDCVIEAAAGAEHIDIVDQLRRCWATGYPLAIGARPSLATASRGTSPSAPDAVAFPETTD